MIDQHAAHERILYEKFKSRELTGVQNMLVPATLELGAGDFAVLSGNLDELKEFGFDIEVFGKNSIIVRGVPAALISKNTDQMPERHDLRAFTIL